MSEAGRVAFRVRVGVTGHRRLADEAAIAEAARGWFESLQSWFPSTASTSVQFSLISALAEGADRLIVTTALAALPGDDTQLEAVLPLTEDDYETDFATAQSVGEFRALLASAASQVEVPPVDDREVAYERAGQYVVDRCDVLIAVWDGAPSHGRGGTKETIDYARRQGVAVLRIAADAPDPSPAAEAERPTLLNDLQQAWARIDEYNRLSLEGRRVSSQLAAEQSAFAELTAGPLSEPCAGVTAWALPHLVRADFLAMRYQRRYSRLGDALFGSAALASTVVAAQVVFAHNHPRWALVEVALMLLLLTGVALGRRAHVHDQWIAYRSLAEAFRAAPFIALTGLGDRPEGGEPRTSRVGAERWFQRAFSEAWRGRPSTEDLAVPESAAPELARILSVGWLRGQIDYHYAATGRFKRGQDNMTFGILCLFATALGVAVLHVVLPQNEDGTLPKILEFIAITMPGFGAALSGIRDQRQYRVHGERSQRTADRLEPVCRALATETTLDSIQRLALDAQALMAEENLDWSSVVEFQELEIVV